MNKKNLLLSGFILLKFLLQYLLINGTYELHRDEYLHLDQANHLAWGFLSVPPVTSWIALLISALGNAVAWVKFFPALIGALTLLVVWKTTELLKGNLYALVLGATCVLLSALLRINFLFQPNSLDVLCWTAFYYYLIRYVDQEKPVGLYSAALVFAIGFLNKYNIVFMLIGLLPGLLFTQQRKVLMRKEFYLAALLSLLLISPNLYWQYDHSFPVFIHLKELTDRQLVHVNRWVFLEEQLFFFIGALPVLLAALYAVLVHEPFKKYRFLFWSMVLTLATFIYFRAKGYYAIGIYPIYIAVGAAYLGTVLQTSWKKHLRWAFLAVPLLCYALLFQVFYTIEGPAAIARHRAAYQKLGLLRWEDGRDYPLPQDYADMLGWKELAAKVDQQYNRMPAGSHTVVLCDNYGQAGAINYYTKNKNIHAVSFNADYINWFDLRKPTDNVIRVKTYEGSEGELQKSGPLFLHAAIADSVTCVYAREYKTRVFVFSTAKIDINKRLRSEIIEESQH